jgi:hypothetical protein
MSRIKAANARAAPSRRRSSEYPENSVYGQVTHSCVPRELIQQVVGFFV